MDTFLAFLLDQVGDIQCSDMQWLGVDKAAETDTGIRPSVCHDTPISLLALLLK